MGGYFLTSCFIAIMIFVQVQMRYLTLNIDSGNEGYEAFYWKFAPSGINIVTLVTLEQIYKRLAVVLVDSENHQYLNTYEDSLAVKIYFFQFFNVYLSNFLIAFWYKDFSQLTVNLATILAGKQLFLNILDGLH
jgi:hypothetical protein